MNKIRKFSLVLIFVFTLSGMPKAFSQHIQVALDNCGVTSIYVEQIGHGRPIVIFHRKSMTFLEPVFENIQGWNRIYIDPPGIGKSGSEEWVDNADLCLEVLMKAIEEIIPGEKFAVAGFSYFGYMSMGIISRDPERITGSLLICPVVVPEFNERDLAVFNNSYTDSTFYNNLSQASKEVLDNFVIKTQESFEASARLKNLDVPMNPLFWNNIKKNSYSLSSVGRDTYHEGPALIIFGMQDNVVGFRDGISLINSFPRATFSVLDLASHSLPYEQNQLFNALVENWLERMELTNQHAPY